MRTCFIEMQTHRMLSCLQLKFLKLQYHLCNSLQNVLFANYYTSNTVILEIFARILFSQIELKYIL